VQIEIWSDIVCPWCAIGRARLQQALATFPHASGVDVRYRSFELDPSAPRVREGSQADHLAAKTGRSHAQVATMLEQVSATAAVDGLTFRLDLTRSGNTFDAHRLLHLAAERGIQGAVNERFQTAYFADGEPIGDAAALQRLAVDAGLAADEVVDVLASDRYAAEVRADEAQARALGISGVPFFVIDRRYGVSGAQPVETLLGALHKAWDEQSPLPVVGAHSATHERSPDAACTDDSCAV